MTDTPTQPNNARPTTTVAPPVALDADQRIIIVVFGPSTGGKTTTARALGRILDRPVDGGREDERGRTLDFDWLEFEGGSRNGAPVKVQLITAPGHDPVRRVELLMLADVVLFVADTTAERMDESVSLFAEVVEVLDQLASPPAVVVQANKRDHEAALGMDVVRRRLDLDHDAVLIETIATEGDGVRQAFVFAMRHGIQRLDQRSISSPAVDPGQLRRRLDDLRDHDEILATDEPSPDPVEVSPSPAPPPPPPAASDAVEQLRSSLSPDVVPGWRRLFSRTR